MKSTSTGGKEVLTGVLATLLILTVVLLCEPLVTEWLHGRAAGLPGVPETLKVALLR